MIDSGLACFAVFLPVMSYRVTCMRVGPVAWTQKLVILVISWIAIALDVVDPSRSRDMSRL